MLRSKLEKRGDLFFPVLLSILRYLPAIEAVDAPPHTRLSIWDACKMYGVLLVTLYRHFKKLSNSLRTNIFYILWTMMWTGYSLTGNNEVLYNTYRVLQECSMVKRRKALMSLHSSIQFQTNRNLKKKWDVVHSAAEGWMRVYRQQASINANTLQ